MSIFSCCRGELSSSFSLSTKVAATCAVSLSVLCVAGGIFAYLYQADPAAFYAPLILGSFTFVATCVLLVVKKMRKRQEATLGNRPDVPHPLPPLSTPPPSLPLHISLPRGRGSPYGPRGLRAPVTEDAPLPKKVEGPSIYGPEAWEIWGVRPKGPVPPRPCIDWEADDPLFPGKKMKETTLLFFLPSAFYKIEEEGRIEGEPERNEIPFCLSSLLELDRFRHNDPLRHVCNRIIMLPHNVGPRKWHDSFFFPTSWVVMKKMAPPSTLGACLSQQEEILHPLGYQLPLVEALVAGILLHHAHTGERLFPEGMHARCKETLFEGKNVVSVGGFREKEGFQIQAVQVNLLYPRFGAGAMYLGFGIPPSE